MICFLMVARGNDQAAMMGAGCRNVVSARFFAPGELLDIGIMMGRLGRFDTQRDHRDFFIAEDRAECWDVDSHLAKPLFSYHRHFSSGRVDF